MESEDLQKLTASEPLTLHEEFEMQISWREDEDSKMCSNNELNTQNSITYRLNKY